jgi:clan AA aspartic protease (TIGR02281 family)
MRASLTVRIAALTVCLVPLGSAHGGSLETLATEQGCIAAPIAVDGTDLYKCQIPGAMSFFAGPSSSKNLTEADSRPRSAVRDCRPFAPVTPQGQAAQPIAAIPNAVVPTIAVPLKKRGGAFAVPILVNDALTLSFLVDSGASDVSIPEDVVTNLMRTGTLRKTDFLGEKTYVLADGSKKPSKTFCIGSMKIGDRVVENVVGHINTVAGPLLLGQSFLRRFSSWSIDNDKNVLILTPGTASPGSMSER